MSEEPNEMVFCRGCGWEGYSRGLTPIYARCPECNSDDIEDVE